jgi:hypothetical protein
MSLEECRPGNTQRDAHFPKTGVNHRSLYRNPGFRAPTRLERGARKIRNNRELCALPFF